ncbi:hypothetical protein ATY41_09655 [Leifsonia xyli subsp. xyli]|uniref:Histidinol dehydrogenase n=2 Tax=Leifsonia xyli subsp. xyli TaxID=59736 RepID=Q6ADY2_LEIXX|nr:hypothetical protein [Leifsonia xyli]AAT89414.1 conserved hypothetical protein [Leifsonia xyli subsp. xyli str. CTCB07]ODA90583.1 hypothetical protein ATY41_09655 [Leifsonia xyli subsp. xyli]
MLSRIVSAVPLLIVGAIVGGVGTVAHQIAVGWGVPIPLGLIGSLLAIAALLAGLRLLGHSRVPAALAAAGTLGTILVFAQQSPGGSVLIPDNALGQIWLVAPFLIAAVALAWPDLSRRGAGPAL